MLIVATIFRTEQREREELRKETYAIDHAHTCTLFTGRRAHVNELVRCLLASEVRFLSSRVTEKRHTVNANESFSSLGFVCMCIHVYKRKKQEKFKEN